MNLGEMITRFRIQAGDTVKKYLWPDDELSPWFSEAEKEAAIRGRLIRRSEEIAIAVGDTVLDLPKGLFDIQYAELRAADGTAYEIKAIDHAALDALRPGWRAKSARPQEFIHNDKALQLGSVSDGAYTLFIEFFREPKRALESASDAPEINETHHIHLIDWVLHKAYSKPDAETMNPGKAAESEDRFTRYFGKRPSADLRRRHNASRPHRNRVHL